MKFTEKVDKNLKRELKKTNFIDKNKIEEMWDNSSNKKLMLFFDEKIDYFYNKIINYTKNTKLSKNLYDELKLFEYYSQEANKEFMINNFEKLIPKLKKLNSNFTSLSNLYLLYFNDINKNPQLVYDNLISSWEEILITSIVNDRIKKIEKERDFILRKVYNKFEILRKQKDFLNMFPNYFNFFWNKNNKEHKKINVKSIKKYAKPLSQDPVIERISFELGRRFQLDHEIKDSSITIEKKIDDTIVKENINSEELIGMHEDNNLKNLVPSELMYLNNKAIETIFYLKFSEKKLRILEFESDYEGKALKDSEVISDENIHKFQGDVIICIDTSSSMKGPFEFIGKSLLLAILHDILNVRNRNCVLINFSDNLNILDINNIYSSPESLNDFLELSFDGGTDYDSAFNKVFEFMKFNKSQNKYTDLLMISDFLGTTLKNDTKATIKDMQTQYLNFYGIQIGKGINENISELFNGYWVYDPNDPFTCQKFLNTLLEYNNNYKNVIK